MLLVAFGGLHFNWIGLFSLLELSVPYQWPVRPQQRWIPINDPQMSVLLPSSIMRLGNESQKHLASTVKEWAATVPRFAGRYRSCSRHCNPFKAGFETWRNSTERWRRCRVGQDHRVEVNESPGESLAVTARLLTTPTSLSRRFYFIYSTGLWLIEVEKEIKKKQNSPFKSLPPSPKENVAMSG